MTDMTGAGSMWTHTVDRGPGVYVGVVCVPVKQGETPAEALAAADRAVSIVRVNTRDEALVEQLAMVMVEARSAYSRPGFSTYPTVVHFQAAAVLAALREADR